MRAVIASSVLVAAILATGGEARADLRSFTHTYEYGTMPAGQTAVELWHTQTRALSDASSPQLFQGILEVEHGITDHWDIAFYSVLEQIAAGPSTMVGGVSAEPLHFAEAKLETRYRFAERGELPVDTLVYLELAKEFGESVYEIEGKVIGSRDFGDITVAGNAIAEVAVGKDVAETELELGWAVGATYQAHPKIRLGVETWGALEDGEAYVDAGPTVSFALSSKFWTALTAGFALTERGEVEGVDHGVFSARAIMGIEL